MQRRGQLWGEGCMPIRGVFVRDCLADVPGRGRVHEAFLLLPNFGWETNKSPVPCNTTKPHPNPGGILAAP